MTLTPEQREAAIERMADRSMRPMLAPVEVRALAEAMLDALRDAGFIVLHKDDVETEYGAERPSPLYLPNGDDETAFVLDQTFTYREKAEAYVLRSTPYSRVVSRLVTRWEPVTKETP